MRPIAILEGLLPIISLIGFLMITVPVVDVFYGGDYSSWFLVIGVLCIFMGLFTRRVIESKWGVVEVSLLEALFTYSLAWIITPLITAIPLTLELSIPYVDAVFESMSGFTGTGLTILRDLNGVKRSILYWRGLMQWAGELGVIVFAAVFFPFFWRFGYILYSLERPTRISTSLRETALKIFYIYFLITVIGVITCIYLGVEPLDALVHSMTAVATGGMSNYDLNYESVYRYAPLSIYPITILMVIGGFSFVTLNYLLDFKLDSVFRNEEMRIYLLLNTLISLILVLILTPTMGPGSMVEGVFNAISAATTTGFSIGRISEYPDGGKLILVLAMFIGAMSFSTGGGIKVVRFIILIKKFKSYIISFLTGETITPGVTLGDSVLEEREVSNNLLYIVLHVSFILIGAGVIKSIHTSVDLIEALFESTSASSNVGLSIGLTTPETHIVVKVVLMLLMYMGRLEYIPLYVLTAILFYRKYRIFIVR